ncbi:hypothetical protein Sjap_022760 [Stephania japonica]|uniref:Uncharacterized protein n=1 Tax=Stephania japonica TaxID=461633 RepID=A0AAP0EV59_9MAGN
MGFWWRRPWRKRVAWISRRWWRVLVLSMRWAALLAVRVVVTVVGGGGEAVAVVVVVVEGIVVVGSMDDIDAVDSHFGGSNFQIFMKLEILLG